MTAPRKKVEALRRALIDHADLLVGISAAGLAFSKWRIWPLILVTMLIAARRLARARTAGTAFREGYLLWLGALTWIIHWIEYVVRVYGGLPFPVSAGPLLLLAGYCALYPAAAGWLAVRLESWRGDRLAWWPLTLAGLEIAREHLLTGFGWGSPGYALAASGWLRQAADLGGVYLLTGLVALWAGWIVRGRSGWAAVLLLAWTAYGGFRVATLPAAATGLRVGVVQGNIDQWRKWNAAMVDRTIDIYLSETGKLRRQGPLDLVVWPETALPFYWQYGGPRRARVLAAVRRGGYHLITGVPAVVRRRGSRQSRNRAILVDPEGRTVAHVDKNHLVPFGEYVPLRPWLDFVDKMVAGVGDFSPGDDDGVLTGSRWKVGISICYEILFAGETRDRLAGADLLAVITNDAWFGPTDAPYQLVEMGVMRVVENRIPMVRAANTGVSLWADIDGNTHRSTPIFRRAGFRDTIPLRRAFSLYRLVGKPLETACMFFALAALLVYAGASILHRRATE